MRLYQQSLELDERLGDLKGKAATLHEMANVLVTRGDLDGAMRLYQQSLELDERLGDLQGKAATLHAMANVLVTRGDLDGAMRLYQQSLELEERLGDLQGKSATLHAMAYILHPRRPGRGDAPLPAVARTGGTPGRPAGQIRHAARHGQRAGHPRRPGRGDAPLPAVARKWMERLGDLKGKAATLHAMASVLVTRGDLDGAMRLYQQSLELEERLGDLQGKAATLHAMANVLVTRGDLDGAMRLYQQSLELDERLGNLQGKAITLGTMGQALWAQGKHGEAIASLWSGLKLLRQLKIEPQTQQAMASVLADWREQMGAEAFDRLWQQVTGGEGAVNE
jgi:tetratricopeptide (TPR) repeat protein